MNVLVRMAALATPLIITVCLLPRDPDISATCEKYDLVWAGAGYRPKQKLTLYTVITEVLYSI